MSAKSMTGPPLARLLVALPADRYRFFSFEGRVPRIGDVVIVDQAFTGPDGRQMVLAYFAILDRDLYEAEVYTSELEKI